MKPLRISRSRQAALGALVLLVLVLAPARHLLENSMRLHMLAQYPLIMLCGALLGCAMPPTAARRLAAWNAMGLAGLVAALLFTSVLMIPRVLDLVLVDWRVEAAKFAALLFVGALLHPSWRAAGRVVQAFFLGSMLPMMVAVGSLYQNAPARLCNAYRLDDQQALGTLLVYLAAVIAVVWLVRTTHEVMHTELDEGLVR